MNTKQMHNNSKKLSRKIHKIDFGVGYEIAAKRVKNKLNRFLKHDLRKNFKPLLVLYFTHQTQEEIRRNNFVFLDTIQKKVNNKFYILLMPAMTEEEVRAELWCKGKLLDKFEKKLFENNIWAFHSVSKGFDNIDFGSIKGMMDDSTGKYFD